VRAEWDQSVEVYNGAGHSSPYLFRGIITCRIVTSGEATYTDAPFNSVIGYMNYFSAIVAAGTNVIDPPFFKCDPLQGSIIREPVTGMEFTVLARQLITPAVGGNYFRAILIDRVA